MRDRLVINGAEVAAIEFPEAFGEYVKDWDVGFRVETEEQLREVAGLLGGIERLHGDGGLLDYRPEGGYFAESERGVTVNVHVWLSDELAVRPTPEPPTVVKRLRDEAAALAADAAAEDAEIEGERGVPFSTPSTIERERAALAGDEEAALLRGRPVGPSGQPCGSTVSTEPGVQP